MPSRFTQLLCLIFTISITATSCGPDRQQRVCIAGEPTPFFSTGDSTVVSAVFKGQGQNSTENITFADGTVLAINQVGCDTVIQTFDIPTPTSVASFPAFKELATSRFRSYAQLAPKFFPFAEYARVLDAVPDGFPIGAPANLAPGLVVRAFRVPTTGGTTWQLRYEQDLTIANGR